MENKAPFLANCGYYTTTTCSIGWKLSKRPIKYFIGAVLLIVITRIALIPTINTISGISKPAQAHSFK